MLIANIFSEMAIDFGEMDFGETDFGEMDNSAKWIQRNVPSAKCTLTTVFVMILN
jgi:hypothetical protein